MLPLSSLLAICVYVCLQIQSEIGAATVARHAAGRIFRLEDDSLLIDPLGEAGAKGPSKGSAVEFLDVKFTYPRRPDAQARTRVTRTARQGGGGTAPLACGSTITPTLYTPLPILSFNSPPLFYKLMYALVLVGGLAEGRCS